jgi:hypothetical protein
VSDAGTGWATGDLGGLAFPVHSDALRQGGVDFLTSAFLASGALARDNQVLRIEQFEEWPGGSTGRKLLLTVAYERPAAHLPTELFVKFSRDFDDAIRDRGRRQMQSEVRFAAMSRLPAFPIRVPLCLFADYETASGSGILITQRIGFDTADVEPHYGKCLDYEMPNPLEHYRAVVRALARLAGTHKAGRFPAQLMLQFPFDAERLAVSERPAYSAQQLRSRVARYAAFAARYPQLLPADVREAGFIADLTAQVARFAEHEAGIKRFLHHRPELVALCHWNANIDNAWFYRNAQGELDCGLLDWGHVSQMNLAMSLWGCLSAAETELWDRHLDELLALFVTQFDACGAAPFDPHELQLHLRLYIALMGLAWLLDVPALIQPLLPPSDQLADRFDGAVKLNETVRVRLQMMTTFLHLWRRLDFPAALDQFLIRTQRA